jgi:serine/threonine protein kinase
MLAEKLTLTLQKNVLIGKAYQAQVTDFGLLLLDDMTIDATRSTERAYALHWASPERLYEERRTREDDIYALGCLGYMVRRRSCSRVTYTESSAARPAPQR